MIHHQGVLEHFTVPQIRAALAQQVALAHRVVFSVPSVHYPFDGEFGDERLLPLEEWQLILEPFEIEELRYHGDPNLGGREHVLCVLRGQPVTDELRALMQVPPEPYLSASELAAWRRSPGRRPGPRREEGEETTTAKMDACPVNCMDSQSHRIPLEPTTDH